MQIKKLEIKTPSTLTRNVKQWEIRPKGSIYECRCISNNNRALEFKDNVGEIQLNVI